MRENLVCSVVGERGWVRDVSLTKVEAGVCEETCKLSGNGREQRNIRAGKKCSGEIERERRTGGKERGEHGNEA